MANESNQLDMSLGDFLVSKLVKVILELIFEDHGGKKPDMIILIILQQEETCCNDIAV